MNKSIFYLIIIASIFYGCKENKNNPSDSNKIVISGIVENNTDPFIIIKNFYNGFHSYKANISQDGKFQFELDTKESNYYTLQLDNKSTTIYTEPGDNIIISVNAKEFLNSVKFEGTKKIINTYLKDKKVFKNNNRVDEVKVFKLPTNEFRKVTDSIFNSDQKKLDIFANQNDVSKEFIELEEAEILYVWANWMYDYPSDYKNLTKNEFKDPDGTYFDYIKKLDFNNGNIIKSGKYTKYLDKYVISEVRKYVKENINYQITAFSLTELSFEIVDRDIVNQSVKDKLCYDIITRQFNYYGSSGIEHLMSTYNKLAINQGLKDEVKREYNEFVKIHKGKTAPPIDFYTRDGVKYNLEKFSGKYVYIDVWASWCGPCISEYKIIEKLKNNYAGKNIEFIGISVDDDRKKWEDAIDGRKMEGLQFIMKNGWSSSLIKDYKIVNLPRFILLDPNGKIINSNAPRPSQNITEILDKLIL